MFWTLFKKSSAKNINCGQLAFLLALIYLLFICRSKMSRTFKVAGANYPVPHLLQGYNSKSYNSYQSELPCYQATLTDNKFSCPLCGAKEGGTSRIITHFVIGNSDCPNKHKQYCQQSKGGRRKTKKARRNRRRYSRRN
jgi:hypothetical protein